MTPSPPSSYRTTSTPEVLHSPKVDKGPMALFAGTLEYDKM